MNELFQHTMWDCAFLFSDLNDVWKAWFDLFYLAVDQCIPKCVKRKNRRLPWVTDEIIQLAKEKRKMYSKVKSAVNRDDLWLTYKNASNLLKKICNQAKWEYLNNLADNLHTNDDKKLFWNYVAAKRKGTIDLISLKNGNVVITNDLDIAQTSVFTEEDQTNLPEFEKVVNDAEVTSLQCSQEDGIRLLSGLKQNKFPGPRSDTFNKELLIFKC